MIFLHNFFCIELFYSLFLVHIFLPVTVLLLNFLPVDLLLLESPRFLPLIFLHMILFTCVKFTFFTCECFTCGFFTCRESPLFTCDFFISGFCTCGSVLGFAVCASCFLLLIFSPQKLVLRGGEKFAVPRSLIGILRSIASLNFQACIVLAFHTFRESPQNLLSK